MSAYHICLVQPAGYLHSAAFAEVADTFEHALRRLGHAVTRSAGPGGAGARTIVLGSNLLAHVALSLPADAILYNLEQLDASSSWLTPPLLDLFRRHPVWDYSARNAARYAGLGLPAPRVVPIGWVPELERVPRALEEDIDVLFYGSINDRRRAALEAVRAAGLRVETAFGIYGAERDALIARAKIVLNVHFYQAKVLELVRLSYLLGNRRCVVSERGADEAEARALEQAVAFAAYEDLAATCARLAGDPRARRELGEAGHALMASRDATAILEVALEAPASPAQSDDPWRGSRRTRILLAPDLARADDCWRSAMAALAPAAAANPDVTLGIALPLELLATAPAELVAASGDCEGTCDLLLIEAPTSAPAWERLFAGTSLWVKTSPRQELAAAAERVGVEIRDLAGVAPSQ